MTQIVGLNVKNLSNVETFVSTGFDEGGVFSISPPSPATPEDETKDKKDDHSQNYTHDDPCDGTLRNTVTRSWTVKETVGNPETDYRSARVLASAPLKQG